MLHALSYVPMNDVDAALLRAAGEVAQRLYVPGTQEVGAATRTIIRFRAGGPQATAPPMSYNGSHGSQAAHPGLPAASPPHLGVEASTIADLRQRAAALLGQPQRLLFFSLLVFTAGETQHMVDFRPVHCGPGDALFITPQQVFQLGRPTGGGKLSKPSPIAGSTHRTFWGSCPRREGGYGRFSVERVP